MVAFIGGFFASIAGPGIRAIMLNVNTPEVRGMALAMATTTDDLGRALGPAVVSLFIHHMGRTAAFNLGASAWLPCALVMGSMAFFIRRDEEEMQVCETPPNLHPAPASVCTCTC